MTTQKAIPKDNTKGVDALTRLEDIEELIKEREYIMTTQDNQKIARAELMKPNSEEYRATYNAIYNTRRTLRRMGMSNSDIDSHIIRLCKKTSRRCDVFGPRSPVTPFRYPPSWLWQLTHLGATRDPTGNIIRLYERLHDWILLDNESIPGRLLSWFHCIQYKRMRARWYERHWRYP